jgi:hypothetical protein
MEPTQILGRLGACRRRILAHRNGLLYNFEHCKLSEKRPQIPDSAASSDQSAPSYNYPTGPKIGA